MNKVLSLIIPTYNMENYLHVCLNSLVVDAGMDDFEVLVINDGSTDASSYIAHIFQNKYPDTFRVIDKENGNYGSCINRGIKEAKGKYVKVLDADDSFDSVCFEKYLSVLKQTDVDLVLSDFVTIDETSRKETLYSFDYPHDKIMTYTAMEYLLVNNKIAMHMVAYKLDNIRSIQYVQTEGISYTDQEWIFTPMTTVNTAYYISAPLYRYLIGRDGQTMSPDNYRKSMAHHTIILNNMFLQLENSDLKYYSYLCSRIHFISSLIYHGYLLGIGNYSLEQLSELDAKLCSACLQVYDELEKEYIGFRIIKFRYIKMWRNNNKAFLFVRRVLLPLLNRT